MGKLKGKSIPRKLKKEMRKVECIEKRQPLWKTHMHTSPMGDSMTYGFNDNLGRVKFKQGVRFNKWTRILVRNIQREERTFFQTMMMSYFRGQPSWLEKLSKDITPEQFRKEYLNEPTDWKEGKMIDVNNGCEIFAKYVPPVPVNGVTPKYIIVDELDDVMPNFRTKQEELEWLERIKLWHQGMMLPNKDVDMVAPQAILKIKPGAFAKEDLEEFRREWQASLNSGKPLMLSSNEAEVEFIPAKRPHRLHNHPKKEMELCAEDEVIVDVEFVTEFCWYRPCIDNATGKYDNKHVIVRKNEYRAKIEGSRERERGQDIDNLS